MRNRTAMIAGMTVASFAAFSAASGAVISEDFSYALTSDSGDELVEVTGSGWTEQGVNPPKNVASPIVQSPTDANNHVLQLSYTGTGGNDVAGVGFDDPNVTNISGDVYVNLDARLPNATGGAEARVQFYGESGELFVWFRNGTAEVIGSSTYTFKNNLNQNVTLSDNVWYRVFGVLHIDPTASDATVSTFDLTLERLDTHTVVGTATGELRNDPTAMGGGTRFQNLLLYAREGDTVLLDNLHLGSTPIPEPGSLALLGLGGLALLSRKRQR